MYVTQFHPWKIEESLIIDTNIAVMLVTQRKEIMQRRSFHVISKLLWSIQSETSNSNKLPHWKVTDALSKSHKIQSLQHLNQTANKIGFDIQHTFNFFASLFAKLFYFKQYYSLISTGYLSNPNILANEHNFHSNSCGLNHNTNYFISSNTIL